MLFFYLLQVFVLLAGRAAAAVEFTRTLDVENASEKDYKTFLELLRTESHDQVVTRANNRFVLPPSERENPTRFFDVILRVNADDSLRVRLRRDNLYVIGYTRNGSNVWNLLQGVPNSAVFQGETVASGPRLPMIYDRLASDAGAARSTIPLGQQSLETAVRDLLRNAPVPDRARGVIVIAHMVSEAMRFTRISNAIVSTWWNPQPLSEADVRLTNGWGDISDAVLHAAQDPQLHWTLPANNNMMIGSFQAAIAIVALLLRSSHGNAGSSVRRSVKMPRADVPQWILPGRRLYEVFDVVINNIDGEDPGDLFGTVRATDAVSSYTIYDRKSNDYEEVSPGGKASLTGPGRVLSAAGPLSIDIDLWDHDADASPNDSIIKQTAKWEPFEFGNNWDKLSSLRVDGPYGWGSLITAAMSNAAEAEIKVIMINGDGEDPAQVFGTIKSTTSAYKRDIILLKTESAKAEDVRPNAAITLQRSSVAVPMDATLTIAANLWDWDAGSANDDIASATAQFTPELYKSVSKRIKGADGEVEVRISWN